MNTPLFEALRERIDLDHLTSTLKSGTNIRFRNAIGSSRSLITAALSDTFPGILAICSDEEEAAAKASDIQQLGLSDVHHFPPTRQKPYDLEKLPDPTVLVQRSDILGQIQSGSPFIVSTSVDAISDKLISASAFQKDSLLLSKGETIPPDTLRERLADQGYRPVTFVDEPGEFAVRGGIFDIWSYGGEFPVRLEFFGDELESLREFDPDSQRSIAFLERIRLLPNSSNIEGEAASLLAYLPQGTLIWIEQPSLVRGLLQERFEAANAAYEDHIAYRKGARNREDDTPDPKTPEELYLSGAQWDTDLTRFPFIESGFSDGASLEEKDLLLVDLPISTPPEFGGSFARLRTFLKERADSGDKTMILCDNRSQLDRMQELLSGEDHDLQARLLELSLHEGFVFTSGAGTGGDARGGAGTAARTGVGAVHRQGHALPSLAVLTDHQIFNRYHRARLKRKRVAGGISLKELRDLNIGDYVVHVDHGIGVFEGFKQITVRDIQQEAAVLRYQGDSLLYVNVSSLHKLQKYSGKEGAVPSITKLGSGEWARKKAKTRSRLKDIARELIQLYAKRKAQPAHAFQPDTAWQTEMEARFEYEETPDQLTCIDAVKKDMESRLPMDRLVCGDVGFGKTEVAIRAAFKAVVDQKQVAVLAPTTILADQHFKTFSRRMKEFPVRIGVLSRFVSPQQQKKTLQALEEGQIDILIGTHRIVSKDVKFKDLGLLIIDEEQRFGVAVKDRLKEFRASVDVLTLTATPIPRTLQFSLMGARDLSVIQTPPPNRQPVYTEIHSYSEELIREAILNETDRGGQVFFIHNRVQSIEEMADILRGLVPNVRMRVAHGQMPPTQLEKIIQEFYEHRFDVLLSTNIVENGIDISNANTIIIHNAHAFGLSELHQLRGRVGRSNRKAFCYLITPPVAQLTMESRKRLMALEEFSDLGAGFHIAMRDLDIRGAGDLLGAEQSGFINEIGFDLYTKILNEAVAELKETEFKDLFEGQAPTELPVEPSDTSLEFDQSAMLDPDYVGNNVERLNLYRKLAGATSEKDFTEWREELADRFGPLPEAAETLLLAARIRFHAARWLLSKITFRAGRIWLLCPKADTPAGQRFYEEGVFQDLLERLGRMPEHAFELSQKQDAVRIIVQGIESLDALLMFFKRLGGGAGVSDRASTTSDGRNSMLDGTKREAVL